MNRFFTLAFLTLISLYSLKGQTTADFEFSNLGSNEYWNGDDEPGGTSFQSGNTIYPNAYDTSFGGYWASGWAYGNMQNDTTAGFTNQYSAITASGFQSETYAIGQQDAIVKLDGIAQGGVANGFYVTNSTYAYLSMKNGDFFGKVFGDSLDANGINDGTSGEDFFKLTIQGYYDGQMKPDSIEVFLADYRFSDSSLDYILNDWQWVNLKHLGNIDSLNFKLSSSDNGFFGMNTPAFFCIDNFITADMPKIDTTTAVLDGDTVYVIGEDTFELFDGSFVPLSINTINEPITNVYPNPTNSSITISSDYGIKSIRIMDNIGRIILQQNQKVEINRTIDLTALKSGWYHIQVEDLDENRSIHKIIKQ